MSGVFANGLEISGKAVNAKTIAAFPDVCFTPPQTPATPPGVPIPYPSFGMASNTEKGTGKVVIGNKTVNLKNKSDISKTSGTEAGSTPKKGIITSNKTGKKYFNSWSSDVKFEGEPVIRFTDLATHNHSSPGGQTPPWIEVATAAVPRHRKRKCIVGHFSEKQPDCPKPNEFHHIVPDRTYRIGRRRVRGLIHPRNTRMNKRRYPSHGGGMCICLPPENHIGRKNKPAATAVHKELDNKLTKLGSGGTPPGTATVAEITNQCLVALRTLVPKYISQACFDIAAKAAKEQTKPFAHKRARCEKSLNDLSPTSRRFLRLQR